MQRNFANSEYGLNFGDFLHYIRKTPVEFGDLPYDNAIFLLEWYNKKMREMSKEIK
jgi:hypothetical protein